MIRWTGLARGQNRHLLLQREFFIDNLLVQIHFIIVMIRWTGLAPWEIRHLLPNHVSGQLLYINVQWFRGGLVFKAHRLVYS